ncbi:FAD binding domain-containing protein [Nocardiopsis flavescens]
MTGDDTPRYTAPADLDGVVAALEGADEGTVLVGGGTMVVPAMTHGHVVPRALVDLGRAGLAGIREEDGATVVGAMTDYASLLAADTDGGPGHPLRLLARAAAGITGGPQIRNRGTLGGSASYANPASDVPGCLVALGARLRLVSARGVREVPAQEFFLGAFRTARRPDEVLAELVLPHGDALAWGYVKFKLAESSWPVVTSAAAVLAGGGLRVALGAAADRPVALDVPAPHRGTADPAWRALVADGAARALAARGAAFVDDVLADAHYRAAVTPVIVARAVEGALRGADRQERGRA